MAQGRDEHRMVFDIRGRRGVAIKIVYAILALLMVASLFLVTGAVNLNTVFGGNEGSSESAVSSFQDQAERIEAKLRKEPENADLLASLTRTRVSVYKTMLNTGAGESQDGFEEVRQELAQVSEDWSKYTEAATKPAVGIALLAAPALFQQAELATAGEEARESVSAAADAQQIVADERPSLNSLSYLSYYLAFAGDFKGAEQAKEETAKLAGDKFARENYENQYEQIEKSARKFDRQLKLEQAQKSAGGEAGGKEALEKSPLGGLGATGLGGTSLGGE